MGVLFTSLFLFFLAHRIMTGGFVGSFKRKQVYAMQYIPVVFLFCKQYYLHYPSIIEQFQSFHCIVYINQHIATQKELDYKQMSR